MDLVAFLCFSNMTHAATYTPKHTAKFPTLASGQTLVFADFHLAILLPERSCLAGSKSAKIRPPPW